MTSPLASLYYQAKPFIPRWLQVAARRSMAVHKRGSFNDVWPIDERAGRPPQGWPGWPEGKEFALVLTHDVDTAQGQDRCEALMALERAMGFRSLFNFVPERYSVSAKLRSALRDGGFEVGVHGLKHDGKYYRSRRLFRERAERINRYLKEWNAVGYRSPSMLCRLSWLHDLDITYDASTFDTDPFEPEPSGVRTIFPFRVGGGNGTGGYIELPYTLPQDFTLFVLLRETDIGIWKRKLDWVVRCGGMALLIAHPDYMAFDGAPGNEEYPVRRYEELLDHLRTRYEGRYWHVLPRDLACWAHDRMGELAAAPRP